MANYFDQFDAPSGGNYFDQFDAPPQRTESPSLGATALDVAKQGGAGLLQAAADAPATIPALTGLAGRGLDALMQKYTPSLVSPEASQDQAKMRELVSQARDMSGYLPTPQTTAGEITRTTVPFVAQAMGAPGSLARNAVAGTAAGLGAYGGEKAAPTPESQPYLEMGGALLGGAAGLRGAENIANRLATRAVDKAVPLSKIEAAKNAGYETAQDVTAARPITTDVLDSVATDANNLLNPQGPRPSVAKGVH